MTGKEGNSMGSAVEFVLNPERSGALYLDSLNMAYGGWGDLDHFRWCFEREVPGMRADLLLARTEGTFAYGTAIHYRNIIDGSDHRWKVALIGSAWTLPEFRGKGLSTQGISRSLDVAHSRECSVVMGFVRSDNVSMKNMVANEAVMVPSRYHLWKGEVDDPGPEMTALSREQAVLRYDELPRSKGGGPVRFVYTGREWSSQFLDRPGNNRIFEIEGSEIAVVQEREDQISISTLTGNGDRSFKDSIKGLMGEAYAASKGLFHYSTDPAEWRILEDLGFGYKDGYFSVMAARPGDERIVIPAPLSGASWRIRNGDRM